MALRNTVMYLFLSDSWTSWLEVSDYRVALTTLANVEMQDIAWVCRFWEDTLNNAVVNTTMRNFMSHTHGEAVLVVCTNQVQVSLSLEQLLGREESYTLSLLGPVISQPGRFNSVLLCQLAMSCTSVPCSSIQHKTSVEGSLLSSISFSSRLTAGKGGSSRPVLFLEVVRPAGPKPSFGM